jgi:hypothetical protein
LHIKSEANKQQHLLDVFDRFFRTSIYILELDLKDTIAQFAYKYFFLVVRRRRRWAVHTQKVSRWWCWWPE